MTVETAIPLATTGVVPVMVEFAATAPEGLKVIAFPLTATGEVSCRVLISAIVDAKVQTERPLAFEAEHAPYILADPVLVALKIGETPEIGLLKASLIVIEIAEFEIPSALTGVVPEMVVVVLLGLPGLKTTVPSALETGVTIERVLVSALFEARVQVATPKALVTEHDP